jgi:hypothetical protein
MKSNSLSSVLAALICAGMTATCTPDSPPETPPAAPPLGPIPCDTSQGSCYAPPLMASWQWQLTCDVDSTCADLSVEVDWYDVDWEETPAATVDAIHEAGAHAACYISAGTWEDWRGDRAAFPPEVIGKNYPGWPGERWLDIRQVDILLPIMETRMAACREKGFDGVQLDNVDGWQNDPGFPLTQQDYAAYSARLANLAHRMGLSAGWENAAENVPALLPYFDWFIMESCAAWDECELAAPMVEAGKFVGAVEYDAAYLSLQFCETYAALGISGTFKTPDLDSYRLPCADP